jgi:hypothetical protein
MCGMKFTPVPLTERVAEARSAVTTSAARWYFQDLSVCLEIAWHDPRSSKKKKN